VVVGAVLFALLQFVRPAIPSQSATSEIQAPENVRGILRKDCYSCHSDERRLAWFDEVVPAYWLVRQDVLTARQHLNFSTLGGKPAAAQKATLYEAVNMIQLGAMPLPSFRALHPNANVTPGELETLKAYLAPWASAPSRPGATPPSPSGASARADLNAVMPEYNGLPFEPLFEGWKLIATTERGDNNTFRFILGNDIAVKAAQTGSISPWPDGSRFAKIAWQREPGADGLLHPGPFIQVEFMAKDAQRYKSTDGWGWGRWRGLDLKPYGSGPDFVSECTGCHKPVLKDDAVYTLPITSARVKGGEVVNDRAALPASLPYQPLDWTPVTMYVDPRSRTTATLFGNEPAVRALRARGAGNNATDLPPGPVLALVTWAQRDDPHWFGARIPDRPISVEFVEWLTAGPPNVYRRFDGDPLVEDPSPLAAATERTSFILGLAPAQLP